MTAPGRSRRRPADWSELVLALRCGACGKALCDAGVLAPNPGPEDAGVWAVADRLRFRPRPGQEQPTKYNQGMGTWSIPCRCGASHQVKGQRIAQLWIDERVRHHAPERPIPVTVGVDL